MYAVSEEKLTDCSGKLDGIQVIELSMMDKRKYFPLTMVSSFTIRSILYPFSLIKTRIQVQKGKEIYKGTFDAFKKITSSDGFTGLYRGFWVSNLTIFSSLIYISVYEGTRHTLVTKFDVQNTKVKSFVAGGLASISAQTFFVPVDIVSQHLMTLRSTQRDKLGNIKQLSPLVLNSEHLKSRFGLTNAVINAIHKQYGFRGFYHGYLASLAVFAPNSAMWWFFYDSYCDVLSQLAPVWVPRLVLQCVSAPLGGISSALLTNPLDIIRARMQVEGTRYVPTMKLLWAEEQLGIFTKGLSARLVQSVTFSFFIILGYETIKRWSLLDEFKQCVRW